MSFSLNESGAMALKATRGAGYPWGLAEEAGKATRWLCAQGLDGCAALAGLLGEGFAAALADHAPQSLESPWRGAATLCPLITGAALSDSAARLESGETVIENLAHPLLLLPFVASAARLLGRPLTLETEGFTARTCGARLSLHGTCPERAARLSVRTGPDPDAALPLQTRATPDPRAWQDLTHYAHRTYAPATEESRIAGAGAGLTDND